MLEDILKDGNFFFEAPTDYDQKMVKKKWTKQASDQLQIFASNLDQLDSIAPEEAKAQFVAILEKDEVPLGRVMPALRLALTGVGGGSLI